MIRFFYGASVLCLLHGATGISDSCGAALSAIAKSSDALAVCAVSCLNRTAVGATVNPDAIGGSCAACFLCSTDEVDFSLSAKEFQCSVSLTGAGPAETGSWDAPLDAEDRSQMRTLIAPNACFPAECAIADIDELVVTKVPAAMLLSGWSVDGQVQCDVLGSFVNKNFAWVVLVCAIGIFVLALFVAKAKRTKILLRCTVYLLLTILVLVGLSLAVLAIVLLAHSNFPGYLVLTVAATAVFELLMGLLVYYGAKRAGRPGLLTCSNIFSLLAGILSLGLGLIFQIAGKDWLQSNLEEAVLSLSQDEANDLHEFMQTTNTLMVCVFFIMAGTHLSLIPVCRSLAKNLAESPESQQHDFNQLGEDTSEQRQAKRDREAQKWVAKKRAELSRP